MGSERAQQRQIFPRTTQARAKTMNKNKIAWTDDTIFLVIYGCFCKKRFYFVKH
jgi:hypothetical protein